MSNVGSNERSGLPLQNRPDVTAVLVSLDALFPEHDVQHLDEGLVLRGWTIGALHRWLRSSSGHWIGMCTIFIKCADGTTYKAVDQLVPAGALRKRT